MPSGKVKWFHKKKGYGFITHDSGDVFVHYSVIKGDGFKYLEDGEQVDFEMEKSANGLKATSVSRSVTAGSRAR